MTAQKLIEDLRRLREKLDHADDFSTERKGLSSSTKKHRSSKSKKGSPSKDSYKSSQYGTSSIRTNNLYHLNSNPKSTSSPTYRARQQKAYNIQSTALYQQPKQKTSLYPNTSSTRTNFQTNQQKSVRNPLVANKYLHQFNKFSSSSDDLLDSSTSSSDSFDYRTISTQNIQGNLRKNALQQNTSITKGVKPLKINFSSSSSSDDEILQRSKPTNKAKQPIKKSIFFNTVDALSDSDSDDSDFEEMEILKKYGKSNRRSAALATNEPRRHHSRSHKFDEPKIKSSARSKQHVNKILAMVSDSDTLDE